MTLLDKRRNCCVPSRSVNTEWDKKSSFCGRHHQMNFIQRRSNFYLNSIEFNSDDSNKSALVQVMAWWRSFGKPPGCTLFPMNSNVISMQQDINANSSVIYFIAVSNANLNSYFVKIGAMDLKPEVQGLSLQITPCAPVVLNITQLNYTIQCQSNGISGRYLVVQSIGERRHWLAVNEMIVHGSSKKRKYC